MRTVTQVVPRGDMEAIKSFQQLHAKLTAQGHRAALRLEDSPDGDWQLELEFEGDDEPVLAKAG